MTPEERARQKIDSRLIQSGWTIQDLARVNPMASLGVAVREYPTSTGPVDYALFVAGKPVGVVEAKKDALGENITTVEQQSGRYANSTFKYISVDYRIRFAYEATGELTRFTDYEDYKYRSRSVFSFHRPETLQALLAQPDTIRNKLDRGEFWIEDGAIASSYILLAAEQYSLGACWVHIRNRKGRRKTSDEEIRELLCVPEGYAVLNLIALGGKEEKKPSYTEADFDKNKIHRERF